MVGPLTLQMQLNNDIEQVRIHFNVNLLNKVEVVGFVFWRLKIEWSINQIRSQAREFDIPGESFCKTFTNLSMC